MSSALFAAAAELEATLRQAGTSGHKHEHHDHHKHEHSGHKPPAAGTKQTQGAAASGASNCVGDCVRNWKLIFAFLLFVESIIFGFIPIILRRSACIGTKRFIRFVSFTNVASGGIFLATGLLHILPEASALLSSRGHSHSHSPGAANEPQFPTASAFLLLAYVLFLFFDRILFSSLHNLHQREHAVFPSSEDLSPVKSDVESSRSHEYSELDAMAQMRLNGFVSPRFCSGFLAVLGIAAHSLFESIALGTTKHFPTALNTFIAIASHRWATSLAIGSKLAHDRLKAIPYTTLVLAFSIVAPLGIGIGFAVNNTSEFFQGVIFALSAGIFIYIGASETIAEEFDDEAEMKFAKFFTMVGGIGLMLIITGILVAKGVHGHG